MSIILILSMKFFNVRAVPSYPHESVIPTVVYVTQSHTALVMHLVILT